MLTFLLKLTKEAIKDTFEKYSTLIKSIMGIELLLIFFHLIFFSFYLLSTLPLSKGVTAILSYQSFPIVLSTLATTLSGILIVLLISSFLIKILQIPLEIVIGGIACRFKFRFLLVQQYFEKDVGLNRTNFVNLIFRSVSYLLFLFFIVLCVLFYVDKPKGLFNLDVSNYYESFMTQTSLYLPLFLTLIFGFISLHDFFIRLKKLKELNNSEIAKHFLFGDLSSKKSAAFVLVYSFFSPLIFYSIVPFIFRISLTILKYSREFYSLVLTNYFDQPSSIFSSPPPHLSLETLTVISEQQPISFNGFSKLPLLIDSLIQSIFIIITILVLTNIVLPLVIVYKRSFFIKIIVPSFLSVFLSLFLSYYVTRNIGNEKILFLLGNLLLLEFMINYLFSREEETINEKKLANMFGIDYTDSFVLKLKGIKDLPYIELDDGERLYIKNEVIKFFNSNRSIYDSLKKPKPSDS